LFEHQVGCPDKGPDVLTSVDFVDEVTLEVAAGDGGNGAVAFRREKFVPLGGPSGGDGGRGGSVILVAHDRFSTLFDLRYRRIVRAERGEDGRGKDQFGKAGADVRIEVPVGTQVYDQESDALLADLHESGAELVVAQGGRGGRGNIKFATPYDRAPRRAQPGTPGERKNLGVVSLGVDRTFVIADIPGIIEGASEGAGLGLRFLKHVERTKVLLHMLSVDPDPEREPVADFDALMSELGDPEREPVADFDALMSELGRFDPSLLERPILVAVSKCDLPEAQKAYEAVREALEPRGFQVFAISSATNEGLTPLLEALEAILREPDDA
jgi:GTP-binding protein